MIKRIVSFLLICVLLVFAAAPTAFSSAETDRIIAQINATFEKAKQLKGVTHFELCTEYVKFQLNALGITSKDEKDIGGNGTKMYYLVEEGLTSTGYTKTKYEGSNCVYNIVSAYNGANVYNILISWYHGFRNTYESPGPGHVVFIHAIIDGIMYYSESYPTGDGILEGQPRINSIQNFYNEYNGYYGNAVGAVVFSKGQSPHTAHDFKLKDTVSPTCTEEGKNTYACTVCGYEYSESIPAAGHKYETVITEPTCTEEGSTKRVCKVCGDTVVDRVVPAKGHDYETVTVEPTCTEEGCTKRVCKVCGDTVVDEVVYPLGHDYSIIVTKPTCLEDGGTVIVCDVCGYVASSKVDPATGHNFVNGFCTVCGMEEIAGDVNGDGKLNAKDVVALMKLLISAEIKLCFSNDVNADGKLNAKDVIKLMKKIVSQSTDQGEN